MSTFGFNEIQLIDVRISSIEYAEKLESTSRYTEFCNYLKQFNIRIETCIDLQLNDNYFYIKVTPEVEEKLNTIISILTQFIESLGFIECENQG